MYKHEEESVTLTITRLVERDGIELVPIIGLFAGTLNEAQLETQEKRRSHWLRPPPSITTLPKPAAKTKLAAPVAA